DDRTTTHLFLTARAFGADRAVYTGQRDRRIEDEMREIAETWGGSFEVEYEVDWKNVITDWKGRGGEVVHLTMYGLPAQDVIDPIRRSMRDKLIVVGGAKVPGGVFRLADWNVSITSQPHSEVSALSVFLHELFEGRELVKAFEDARMTIVPQAKGKKIVRHNAQ
ncbi:MAG: tRNA (cytidine(56)-2'-O)-methyltransferase, partial [Candidatus Bathyarchaeia archaeon]